jgi:hypothetical protein
MLGDLSLRTASTLLTTHTTNLQVISFSFNMKCYILIAGLLGTLALASPVADPVANPVADAVADAVADPNYEHGYDYKSCEEIHCTPVKCHGTEWVCI